MVKNYAALGHIPSGFVQGIHFHNQKMHVHLILICKTAVALNDPSLRCNMH